MFFFQWDQEDWKQPVVVMAYALIGIAGSVYVLLNTGEPIAFLGGLADVGGALFLFALVTEGVTWNMVMALGKIREARDRGREEGRVEGRVEGRAELAAEVAAWNERRLASEARGERFDEPPPGQDSPQRQA